MGGSLPTSRPCHGWGRHCEKSVRVMELPRGLTIAARRHLLSASAQSYYRRRARAIQVRPGSFEHGMQEMMYRPRADLAAGAAEDVVAAVRRPGESHVCVGNAAGLERGGEEIGVRAADELVALAVDEERRYSG